MGTSKLRGSIVALVTPFCGDGSIDVDRLSKLVEWHLEEKTDAILVTGTTGEAATMSAEEHALAMRTVIESAGRRVPVICGTGSNSTRKTVETTRRAEELGADAALLVGPYYNKPTQEGFYQHFKHVAASTSLPLLLYNVPGRTGSNISAETTLRLAEIENVVGVKEASGNFSQIMTILARRPQGFLVFSGDDSVALPLMSLGADGVISVAANEAPALFHELTAAALSGQWEQARRTHYRLLPLMEANFLETNPGPVKAALALMGKVEENYRLPMVPVSKGTKERLRMILSELGLIGP